MRRAQSVSASGTASTYWGKEGQDYRGFSDEDGCFLVDHLSLGIELGNGLHTGERQLQQPLLIRPLGIDAVHASVGWCSGCLVKSKGCVCMWEARKGGV